MKQQALFHYSGCRLGRMNRKFFKAGFGEGRGKGLGWMPPHATRKIPDESMNHRLAIVSTAIQGMGKRSTIHEFQISPQWYAERDSAYGNSPLPDQFRNVLRCCFSLYRGAGRQDDFPDIAGIQVLFQSVKAQVFRANAVQGRQMPQQHEELSLVIRASLYGRDIGGGFHHAQQRRIPIFIRAEFTQVRLGERAANPTIPNAIHGFLQRVREPPSGVAIPFQ